MRKILYVAVFAMLLSSSVAFAAVQPRQTVALFPLEDITALLDKLAAAVEANDEAQVEAYLEQIKKTCEAQGNQNEEVQNACYEAFIGAANDEVAVLIEGLQLGGQEPAAGGGELPSGFTEGVDDFVVENANQVSPD